MHEGVAHCVEMALADIIVPRGEIEIADDLVMIEVVRPAEAAYVGGDELARVGELANRRNLHMLKAAPCVGDEMTVLEHEAGIARGCVERNLAPAVIGLAPVGGRPMLVERIEGAEAVLEPRLKLPPGRVVEGLVGELVADLPADHVGIVAEAASELFCDFLAVNPIERIGEVELAAAAVLRAMSGRVDAQRFRVRGSQPRGRRIGGSADYNGDMMFGGEVDCAVEPIEIVAALRGLHAAPGEFAYADYIEVRLLHQAEVVVPARLRPLFRIPCGANEERRIRCCLGVNWTSGGDKQESNCA